MSTGRERPKSTYGAFATRERELQRSRARRDATDAAREAEGGEGPAEDATVTGEG